MAAELTDDVTFLGAHAVPPEYEGRADEYVELVCGEMLEACRPHARWIDVFCEEGAFDADQSRARARGGPRRRPRPARARQPARLRAGRAARRRDGRRLGRPLHLPDATTTSRRSPASDTVATFLPATDFSTRQPYPDARRAIDAGVDVAIATNCNPGSSYTTSMAFCIALAVRDMHMTPEEALLAATRGGARALRRDDVGRLAPGARADAVILDAPSYTHLVYRPGVPLVGTTVIAGRVAYAGTQHLR